MKIKKGDKVIVELGKDSGKVSTVGAVLPKIGKLYVEGLNTVKKHKKPTQNNKVGGIVEVEKPMNISNVMVICPNCNKKTRVEIKKVGKTKERICKKCKGSLDKALANTSKKKEGK